MSRSEPQDTTSVRSRSVFKRILLVVATVLALLVLVIEVGSRAADPVVERRRASIADYGTDKYRPDLVDKFSFATLDPASKRIQDARNAPHPYLGYYLKPGFRTAPGAVPQCSHNSFGLRGRETTWEKPSGVWRIVTTGGSSVYGQSESKDEAVWSVRLETYLREARPDLEIEVINGGCNGWTSFEMLINLELRMMDFEPDLVILYETVNDMRAALYTRGGPAPRRDNTHWRATWPVDRPSFLERTLEGSRTYLVWRRYLTGYLAERADLNYWTMVNFDGSQGIRLYCGGEEPWPDGWVPEQGFTSYRRNLGNMISVVERGGGKVLIATQALMMWDMLGVGRECEETQVASFRRIQDIQREVARARGVALAETGAKIEAEERRVFEATGRHMFKNDVHPFDDGSDLIARTVADAVLEADVLPK